MENESKVLYKQKNNPKHRHVIPYGGDFKPGDLAVCAECKKIMVYYFGDYATYWTTLRPWHIKGSVNFLKVSYRLIRYKMSSFK